MNILEMCDGETASVTVEASAARAIWTMLDRHVGAVAIVDEIEKPKFSRMRFTAAY